MKKILFASLIVASLMACGDNGANSDSYQSPPGTTNNSGMDSTTGGVGTGAGTSMDTSSGMSNDSSQLRNSGDSAQGTSGSSGRTGGTGNR